MKKLFFISILSFFLFSCSSDEDTFYWTLFVTNLDEITCSDNLSTEPVTTTEKVTESKIKEVVADGNKNLKERYDAGLIDCLPILSYKKAEPN